MQKDIKELEKIIGYTFRQPDLLERALTHSSRANELEGGAYCGNERLEFLGDAVLDAIVSIFLYESGARREGAMTRIRAAVVCEKSLAAASARFGLHNFIRLGKGEESDGGRSRDSIRADALEAVIGAVYLDGGMAAASKTVSLLLGETMNRALSDGLQGDYKTALQEELQRSGPAEIMYEIVSESGPDHDKRFEAAVSVDGTRIGTGSGNSKKQAQQEAAKAALAGLNERQ
ncbi:MAG TPA: ribonuclease III [Bacillota bacterium]|nr:ribonuclease III [Bacillota bacterium]